jgi:TnsA endonuclease N terminal
MSYSGTFTPSNPAKYVGDHRKIVYRSSWEARFMHKFDKEDWVIAWSSEEIIVPYISPVDGRYHRYFPDFVIKVKNAQGEIKTWMIEVKPKKQTKPPEQKKRVTKQYITEVKTWGVNQAKWNYAKEYCLDRGWEFVIFTEDQLPKV